MPDRPHDEDDDDLELELEPLDPEILAAERRRGQQKTDEAVAKVDIDEIMRQRDSDKDDYYVDWNRLKGYRFTTRHLLILTAVLAMAMALLQQLGSCSGPFVICVIALGVAWYFVARAERRREAEREQIREEFFASRGAVGEAATAAPGAAGPPQRRFDVSFSYSLKELMIAMTVAAVLLGLLGLFGLNAMALTLGIIALVGLVVQATGFDPPRTVVLGWWLLLVFYLGVGLIAAMSEGP